MASEIWCINKNSNSSKHRAGGRAHAQDSHDKRAQAPGIPILNDAWVHRNHTLSIMRLQTRPGRYCEQDRV